GYTFAGWNDGSSVRTAGSGFTWNYTTDKTFTAQWTANKYTVTYACGTGATGTVPNKATATYNATFTPAANTCAKTGYTFAGWNDGSSVRTAGSVFTWNYTTDKTFTAQWSPIRSTITLSNEGADVTGTTKLYATYNIGVYINSNRTSSYLMKTDTNEITIPSKTGYKFMGYYSATTGGIQYITANGYITTDGIDAGKSIATATANWYAQWELDVVRCDAGYYLPANATECAVCPVGSYCVGGTDLQVNNASAQGITQCPNGYTSAQGTIAKNQCYTGCSVPCTKPVCSDKNAICEYANTSTSGVQYYGGTCDAAKSTCEILSVTCKDKFKQTHGKCAAICPKGSGLLKTNGLSFQLYQEKQTVPALNIKYDNGTVCYGNLELGKQSGGAINIKYDGKTYHVVD
ncbi:MAG: InlB B-repeat-containing protein, partial [Alphaproteobacteria bacterium]|nr:InlB B-repeat-containing protein [Alphaproteobacteria bacterium]